MALTIMSDHLWEIIIGAVVAIVIAWIKRDTDKKLGSISKALNNNMGHQLKISAMALRRVADLTRHKNDRLMADVAEEYLAEHEKKSGGG